MSATIAPERTEEREETRVPRVRHIYVWQEVPPFIETSLCGEESRPGAVGEPKSLAEIRREGRCEACLAVAERRYGGDV